MPTRDLDAWMWAEACAMLDRAERLQKQFFRPLPSQSKSSNWEPPVDIFETRHECTVMIALPGVALEHLQITLEGNQLMIVGHRHLPLSEGIEIRRLEIPYGRFERRIVLPGSQFEVAKHELVNGCLILTLLKLQS